MSHTAAPEYTKPLPVPTPESAPYWAAARRHELVLQHCDACGLPWFPPSLLCPECLSDVFTWKPVSGKGTLFSFVVFHRPYHPGFKGDLPYNVSLVELDEGPRLLTNIVGIANDELRVGMSVEVVFDDVTEAVTLPKFRRLP
jgi:uncharacterized OB-fold protein